MHSFEEIEYTNSQYSPDMRSLSLSIFSGHAELKSDTGYDTEKHGSGVGARMRKWLEEFERTMTESVCDFRMGV
jgi:hypothetical protein